MNVGLVDVNWTGHHTPYVDFITRYLVGEGHTVRFFTDRDNPRVEDLPEHRNFAIEPIDFSAYKDGDGEFKTESCGGFVGSLYEQVERTRMVRLLFNRIDEHEIDVVHFLYFERSQIPIRVATLFGSRSIPPIVVTLHRDAFTDGSNDALPGRLTRLATSRAIGSCLSTGVISCLTVHSDDIRDRVVRTVPGATTENVRTIPAPTPSIETDLTKREARASLDLPEGEPILLFFGEHRSEKGPELLFEAVRDLDTPVTVVFAGPGDDVSRADVRRWQDEVEPPVTIVERVEFVPEEEVERYFLAADVLMVPYRRERGISGPLRRACMAGCHLIGADDSDIGGIIERHDLGQLFERGSARDLRRAIGEYLEDPTRYPTENVFEYGESQHWRETGATLEDIYREALAMGDSVSRTPRATRRFLPW